MAKSRKASRTFTIDNAAHADSCGTKYSLRGNTGRFKSKDPRSAAKKAFSSLCRRKRIRGRCVLYISVRETTQTGPSKGKVFTYRFTRRKAATPGPFGQEYEVVGKSVGNVPDKCPKTRKSKGRMFSRTAKGKTGSKSHSRSKSRSGKRSQSKSKSRSGKKSGSKSRSGKKSGSKSRKSRKSTKKANKSRKSRKSSKKNKKQRKSSLMKMLGF